VSDAAARDAERGVTHNKETINGARQAYCHCRSEIAHNVSGYTKMISITAIALSILSLLLSVGGFLYAFKQSKNVDEDGNELDDGQPTGMRDSIMSMVDDGQEEYELRQKLLTEFVGTFYLCFTVAFSRYMSPVYCSAQASMTLSGCPSFAGLAIGVSLMCMVYAGGHISGANYNPTVTLMLMFCRKIDLLTGFSYIITQILAALSAAGLAAHFMGSKNIVVPAVNIETTLEQAFGVEFVYALLLCLVVLSTACMKRTCNNSYYGFAIGFVIVSSAYVGGPISGGAFNPAVGFMPLVASTYNRAGIAESDEWWVYSVSGMFASLVASAFYYAVLDPFETFTNVQCKASHRNSDGPRENDVCRIRSGLPAMVNGSPPDLEPDRSYAVLHRGQEFTFHGKDLTVVVGRTFGPFPQQDLAAFAVEFVGTFYLCLVASLAGIAGVFGPLAVGSVLSVVVYFGGHISGGMYNPAVTFAVFLWDRRPGTTGTDKFSVLKLVCYWVFQLGGSFFAAFVADQLSFSAGFPHKGKTSSGEAFLLEALATMALVYVVLNTACIPTNSTKEIGLGFTVPNHFFGMSIGLTVFSMATFCGNVSGGAFNPAVGTGLPVFHGHYKDVWIYWAAPLTGALMAVLGTYVSQAKIEYAQPLATETPATTPMPSGSGGGIQMQETSFVGDGQRDSYRVDNL
jgi:aquaporin Z